MDFELIKRLLRRLLSIDVSIFSHHKDLEAFQHKHCFNEKLQPLFTVEGLSYLIESMSDNTFYEIFDKINLCAFFFKFEGNIFFIGPYASSEAKETDLRQILIKNNIPASYLSSIMLYCTNYSILITDQFQRIITSIIDSFSQRCHEYTYRRLLGFEEDPAETKFYQENEIDYSDIYKRYESENYLLDSIAKGNVATIKEAFHDITTQPKSVIELFTNTAYQSPSAILRVLARKAAERGGLPVVKIDEITQRYVQKLSPKSVFSNDILCLSDLLTELTIAVNEHNRKTVGLSPVVIKITEHLELNYSQNIAIESLCQLTGYSASRLSTIFKSETGKTITEYIAFIRCERAKELLSKTELSIQNISSYVGYTDNNYFVKVFKKQYQMTPSHYRSQLHKKNYVV